MADRRKQLKKRGKDKNGDETTPTKEEKAVATHVRFNCATNTTMCAGDEVHYFTASKAVDCLMASKWAAAQCKKGDPLFTNRQSCVAYMQNILDKGLFWRARKLVRRGKEREKEKVKNGGSGDANNDEASANGSPKKRKREKPGPDTEASGSTQNEAKDKEAEEKKEDTTATAVEPKEDDKKKKKKVKLEFHSDQLFKDGTDVYVWHFDPVSWTKFLIGIGLILGSIVVCLFPLWPHWLRLGVYYVSLLAMGFVGVLLGLIVLRGIVFACVWAASMGKHHFWILPNLTEDCGFFESFQPAYSHEVVAKTDDTKCKKSKKDKDSDAEEDDNEMDNQDQENGDGSEGSEDGEGGQRQNTDTDRRSSADDAPGTDMDSSAQNTPRHKRDKTANDTNGFEMLG